MVIRMKSKILSVSVFLICGLLLVSLFGNVLQVSGKEETSYEKHGEELTASNYPFSSDYPTVTELYNWYDDLVSNYPEICEKIKFGESWEGRDLYVLKVSDNVTVDEQEPEVLVDGNIHAREWSSHQVASYFLWTLLDGYETNDTIHWLVDNREIFVAPMVNPDGYIYDGDGNYGGDGEGNSWRKNRNDSTPTSSVGVDLNRNWDYFWENGDDDPSSNTYHGAAPFSEYETGNYSEWILSRDIQSYQNIHSYRGTLLLPGGENGTKTLHDDWYRDMAQDMTSLTSMMGNESDHYSYGRPMEEIGYTASGAANDWVYNATGAHGMCYEIETGGSGFYPPEEDITTINKDLDESLIYQARIADTDLGDGTNHLFPPAPYIVYGHIADDGVEVTNTSVEIENSRTGESIAIETDENGYYELNLGTFIEHGYTDTDTFWISSGGTADKLALGDEWGKKIDLNYTAPKTYDISLDKGWNYISSRLLPENTNLISILDNSTYGVPGNYDRLFSYSNPHRWERKVAWKEGFEDDKGWTFTGTNGAEWERGAPQGLGGDTVTYGYGNPDPEEAYSGTKVLGNDLTNNGNYEEDLTDTYYAVSPSIDLSGKENITLEFQRWLGVERNTYDHVYLDVYDGASWHRIWENPDKWMYGGAWKKVEHDISKYADDNPDFKIRFGLGPTNRYGGYYVTELCGWNIDDINITHKEIVKGDRWSTWKSYQPDRAPWFNDLHSWYPDEGIWIYMDTADTLTIKGANLPSTTIELMPGWNMVGYPSSINGNNGLPEAVDKVGYFNFSQKYNLSYDRSPQSFNFEPGQGYWIHNPTNNAIRWTIDS